MVRCGGFGDAEYSNYDVPCNLFGILGIMINMKLSLLLLLFMALPVVSLFATECDSLTKEKRYSKQQLTEDVKYLVTTVADVHPDMYHSIDKASYSRLTDSVFAALHDGMTANEAWPVMAHLIGALNEGHSVFNYPETIVSELKGGGKYLFPILIKEFNGSTLSVRLDASVEDKLQPGDEITGINGLATKALMDWRTDLCRFKKVKHHTHIAFRMCFLC